MTLASTAAPELSALREILERHRATLLERLGAGEDGTALGRANARFLDGFLRARFEAAARAARLPTSGVALAAVGSFGRGAVALRSDADVVLVVAPSVLGSKPADAFAEALLYPLWDITLAVGHQVLSATDAVSLAQKDLPTATALLDLRFLAGDEGLLRDLVARANDGLFSAEDLRGFIERLEAEATARHERFGGSLYLLEPDVKSGAGALRDIDGIRWAARARYRVGGEPEADARLGIWGELVRVGAVVAREAHELAAAEEFLWRVRNRLHARAARKADRLGFEEQESLAVAMGYGDDRARAAERLMQDYYLHARVATRSRESLFERFKPPRRRPKGVAADLGGGVHLFDGHVTIAGSAELQTEPSLAMRVYAACVRHGAPVLPFARDAFARAAADPEWSDRLRGEAEAAALFVELVATVPESQTRRGSMVGELHDVGLLLAMVPEFLPVTGRVHHDVYHVYTVDVHSVAAVDRLRQLARGELAHEFPLASRLAAEIARPRPLFLATLLHDVGKGWPDASGSRKNHSKNGAELCDTSCRGSACRRRTSTMARQLVLDHLLMLPRGGTRRATPQARPGDHRGVLLSASAAVRASVTSPVLQCADLSISTSPTAMTSWKAPECSTSSTSPRRTTSARKPPRGGRRAGRAGCGLRCSRRRGASRRTRRWSRSSPRCRSGTCWPTRRRRSCSTAASSPDAEIVPRTWRASPACTSGGRRAVRRGRRPTRPRSRASPRPSSPTASPRSSRRKCTRGTRAIGSKRWTSSGCATRDGGTDGVDPALGRLAPRGPRRPQVGQGHDPSGPPPGRAWARPRRGASDRAPPCRISEVRRR